MSVYSLLSKPPNIATQQGDFGFILILFIYLLLLVIPSFSYPKKIIIIIIPSFYLYVS